ncbi:MAG: OadG family protein [Synergistaceae bacterium]|jgi:hypothetical protein|nr:OadG family protein [Synergistaceae bacterium]
MNGYEAMSFFWLLLAIVAVSLVFLVVIGVSVIAILKKICVAVPDPCRREGVPGGGAQAPVPASAGTQAASAPSEDGDEIVAVITAAVTAICGSHASVVSVTPSRQDPRQGAGSAWRFTGRLQNFEGFSDV